MSAHADNFAMQRLGEHDTSWMKDAACRTEPTELFYPTRGEVAAAAIAVCADCPVIKPCLEYALDTYQLGIWGGTGGKQRSRIRTQRARRRGAA